MPVPRVLVGDSSKAMLAFWEILLESQFDVVGALTMGKGWWLSRRNRLRTWSCWTFLSPFSMAWRSPADCRRPAGLQGGVLYLP